MHVKLNKTRKPFKCQECGAYKVRASQSYQISPHPAILKLLPEELQTDTLACNKCAKREAGTKLWDRIHE